MSASDGPSCPACGTRGHGRFCSECGGLRQTELPAVGELVPALIAELLNFQHRSFSTLRVVVTSPAALTQAYRDGYGSIYVPPVKLYLGVTALYFLMVAASGRQMFPIFAGMNRTDVVAAATLPLFALWLKLCYGWIGGTVVRLSESLSFAFELQSGLCAVWMPMLWLPDSWQTGAVAAWGLYAAWYIWQGARTLWGERGILAPVRAFGMVIIYISSAFWSATGLSYLWPAVTRIVS